MLLSDMRIAFVVQRYGCEVNGGAEQHCRELAERVAMEVGVKRVAVFTTCARDHGTWANHYPAGRSRLNGVELVRFPVRFQRIQSLMSVFGRLALGAGHRLAAFEAPWFVAQGPYAPDLIEHLDEEREHFDLFVFFSYLYYPTVFGLPRVAERALFVPTAHDEPALRANLALRSFRLAAATAFNTEEERALVASRVDLHPTRSRIVGCGVSLEAPNVAPEKRERPYLLYLGRVESAKGVPEMIQGFRAFRREHADETFATSLGPRKGRDFELVLAGRCGDLRPKSDAELHLTGFVSDMRRLKLLLGCEAVIVPGRLDSLSLSLLEAWALGKPTFANEECPVKRGHSRRSGAGMLFGPTQPLSNSLHALFSDPDALGRSVVAGREYVQRMYAWPKVMERFMDLARSVAATGRESSADTMETQSARD